MKRRLYVRTAIVGGATAFVIAAAVGVAAPGQSSGADSWWKPELDAVTAAPQNHKVLFENDEVRVLEVTVAPGSREPMHVHRYPAVIYVDSSPRMIEHLQDGSSHDPGVRTTGARWLPVAQGHAMENVGDVPLHAIRVELKKSRWIVSGGSRQSVGGMTPDNFIQADAASWRSRPFLSNGQVRIEHGPKEGTE